MSENKYTQEQLAGVRNINGKSNLYDILGVPTNADVRVIKKSYRKVRGTFGEKCYFYMNNFEN